MMRAVASYFTSDPNQKGYIEKRVTRWYEKKKKSPSVVVGILIIFSTKDNVSDLQWFLYPYYLQRSTIVCLFFFCKYLLR